MNQAIHVIAVVKANAYGHGDFEVSKAALEAGASMLAVATPDEAIRLRALGIESPILVLGASPPSFAVMQVNMILQLLFFKKIGFFTFRPYPKS